jgi:hypothetical protein
MAGGFLMILSLAALAYLGFRSVDDPTPSAAESTAIVLLAGSFQVLGGLVVSRVGRADPTLAVSAVKQLLKLGLRAEQARIVVEDAYGAADPDEMRAALGQTSVHLSYIEDGLVLGVENWQSFHSDTLEGILSTDRRERPTVGGGGAT